jgi:hypothetical protein
MPLWIHTDCCADFAPVSFVSVQPLLQQVHTADELGHKPAVELLIDFLGRTTCNGPGSVTYATPSPWLLTGRASAITQVTPTDLQILTSSNWVCSRSF